MKGVKFVLIGMLALLVLTGCAGYANSNARAKAQAEADAEASRLRQRQLDLQIATLQQNQQQAQEASRLAYLNAETQGQRDYYSFLVTTETLDAQEAARKLQADPGFFAGLPTWLLLLAAGALGGLAVAAAMTWLDNYRARR